MPIWLWPPAPGDDMLFSEPDALAAGSASGGVFSALYVRPSTSGRSGSPSRNATETSQPTRGRIIEPPIAICETRSQQLDVWSCWPCRSQKKRTLMRPYLSTWSACSWVLDPVTTAVWMPRMRGRRAALGREGRALGDAAEVVLDVVVRRAAGERLVAARDEVGDHELAVQARLRRRPRRRTARPP